MKILIGCEESQAVTIAFRKLGFEAYSCDLLPCSGGHPEWHLKMDVFDTIKGGVLKTESGQSIFINKWNAAVFHPTCTFLSHAGARWLYPKGILNEDRFKKGLQAKDFFMELLDSKIDFVAVENLMPSKIYELPDPTQIIQPWQFGDEAQKKTLLWLKGFPELKPTNIVGRGEMVEYKSGAKKAKWFMDAAKAKTIAERSTLRSKTFPGIAKAMAEQWGGFLKNENFSEILDF